MTTAELADEPVKLVYLARRKPGLDRDRFLRRWRQHGALGMSLSFWSDVERYAHCDVRGELDGAGQGAESDFDAIGMLWYRAARGPASVDPAEGAAMLKDEQETFSAAVSTSMVMATEHKALERGEAVGVKAVRLIRWAAGPADADEALRRWQEYSRQSVQPDDVVVRHVLNVVIAPADDGSPLQCDVVDELAFSTLDALKEFAKANDLTVLKDSDGATIGTARVFVTNEVMLYDEDYLSSL
jgi:hypothetical protein